MRQNGLQTIFRQRELIIINIKRKEAVDRLIDATGEINDRKLKTDIQSLGELTGAFINTENRAERKRLAADYKKRHKELMDFFEENPELVNAEVERALLSAAIGGEYTDEEVQITAGGRRTYKKKVRRIAPNAQAAAKWLENKDRENWSPNPQAEPELEDTEELDEDIYGKKK